MSLQFVTGPFISLSFSHIVYLYQLLGDVSYTLLVPFSFSSQFFLISSSLQLIITKLYLNTAIANAPIAVFLCSSFNSDFSIFLTSWCIFPSIFPSFVDVRLHVFQSPGTCTFFPVRALVQNGARKTGPPSRRPTWV